MPKRTVLAAALVLAVSACSIPVATGDPTGTSSSQTVPTGTPEPADSSTSSAPTQEPTQEPPAADEPKHFGQSFTWTDGLKVTLSKPKAYRPSEYAAGADRFKSSVIFTATVTNGTGKAYKPTLFQSKCTSGDVPCDQIFDSFRGQELGLPPQSKILLGHRLSWSVAFNVKNPKDLIIELRPGFEYESAIWTY